MAGLHAEVLHGQELLIEKRRQRQIHTAIDGKLSVEPTLRESMVDGRCRECGQFMLTFPGVDRICTDCNGKHKDAKFRKGVVARRLRVAGLLNGEPAHMHLKTWQKDTPI